MFPQSLNFQPINTEQYCMSGDVTIFPGAAIAPGVLLQADVGSRIVIRAGVCVGLGCVIHASHGTITINDGANLGAGVLLIGDVTIGARACLGAAVTVINSSVAARAILESGTVVGDRSRRESIDDIIDDIPMNTPQSTAKNPSPQPVAETPVSNHSNPVTNPVANSFQPSNGLVNQFSSANPLTNPSVNGFNPATIGSPEVISTGIAAETPVVQSTPVVSTFKYPEEASLDLTAPGIVLDNSGKPWQTCDPNPWDPTNHPPGETTCQITSKPKEATPYNPTLFSSQTTASPYPPYPQTSQGSTETISTFKYPEPISHTINPTIAPEPTPEKSEAEPTTPPEPKAIYGQDYVNRMLGKLTGRS
jgi:carbon dioxide concentrating mechanism protein CcmN